MDFKAIWNSSKDEFLYNLNNGGPVDYKSHKNTIYRITIDNFDVLWKDNKHIFREVLSTGVYDSTTNK